MAKNNLATKPPVRPLIAIGLCCVICGLVGGYQGFINSLPARQLTEFVTETAEGDYAVEVTLSFDAEGDAFDPTSMLVRLDGENILLKSEPIVAGVPIRIHPVTDLKVGVNEFFIEVGTGGNSVPSDSPEGDPFAAAGFDTPASTSVEPMDELGDDVDLSVSRVVGVAKAIRVRVFDGDEVLVEKTVWSEPGENISSTIVVDIPANQSDDSASSSHDHSSHNH